MSEDNKEGDSLPEVQKQPFNNLEKSLPGKLSLYFMLSICKYFKALFTSPVWSIVYSRRLLSLVLGTVLSGLED